MYILLILNSSAETQMGRLINSGKETTTASGVYNIALSNVPDFLWAEIDHSRQINISIQSLVRWAIQREVCECFIF